MLVGVLHWSHAKLCQKTWRRDWFAFFFAEGLKCKEISLETLMSWVIAAVLWVKCLIWRLYETAAFLVGHGQRDQSQKGECRMQNFWMGFRLMKQILYLYYLSSIRSIHLSLGLEVPTLGLTKVTSRSIFAALRHGSILFWRSWRCPQTLDPQHFTSCLALISAISQAWSKRTKVKEMLHQPLQCRFHYFRCFHLDFEDGVYIYGLFMEGKDLLFVGAFGFGPN